MSGFTSYDDMIAHISVSGYGYDYNFFKVAPSATQTTGGWTSFHTATGVPGADGNAPYTVQRPFLDNTAFIQYSGIGQAAAGFQKQIVSWGAVSNQNCTLMLYDNLCTASGINTWGTGVKVAPTPALPRYTSGIGLECWYRVAIATNTTAPIVALNYTDSAGAAQSGGNLTFPAAVTVITDFLKAPFSGAAAPGIKSVTSINVVTASASVGTIEAHIIKPLAYLPLIANQWNQVDLVLQLIGLPIVYDQASLMIACLTGANVTPTIWGTIKLAWS